MPQMHSVLELAAPRTSSAASWEAADRVRVFEPGQILFEQGDGCTGLYSIVSGVIGLRRTDEEGNRALLSLAKPGDLLGHDAFLAGTQHACMAEVLTLSRVRFIERSRMTQACARDPSIRDQLVHKVLIDLGRSQERCTALLTQGLKSRLIEVLLGFRDERGEQPPSGGCAVDLPIQRKDLAALIGAAPESLSRLIAKLEAEGMLHIEGRRVCLSRALLVQTKTDGAEPELPLAQSMLTLLMQARCALLALIDTRDRQGRAELEQTVERASASLDALLQQSSAIQAGPAAGFADIWEAFKKTRRTQILPAVHAGKPLQAKKIALGIQAERFARMRRVLANSAAA